MLQWSADLTKLPQNSWSINNVSDSALNVPVCTHGGYTWRAVCQSVCDEMQVSKTRQIWSHSHYKHTQCSLSKRRITGSEMRRTGRDKKVVFSFLCWFPYAAGDPPARPPRASLGSAPGLATASTGSGMRDAICDISGGKPGKGQCCLYANFLNFYVHVQPNWGRNKFLCGTTRQHLTDNFPTSYAIRYKDKKNTFCIHQQMCQQMTGTLTYHSKTTSIYQDSYFYISSRHFKTLLHFLL